jgi:metallo-beta-lactamase family protein
VPQRTRTASLQFLGAAGTVTGSRFLLEANGQRVLVDCGLFQGLKELRLQNWAPFPVPPDSIDAVVLTHAHLDHSGYVPALVRDGYRGPVYGTEPTLALARLLVTDAGHIFEEDAEYANRKGFSKHRPALPLYTEAQAEAAASAFRAVDTGRPIELCPGVTAVLRHAGHILGACTVELRVATRGEHRVVFSGDLGRADPPLVATPEPIADGAGTLVVESTYGDREHPPRAQVLAEMAAAIRATLARGGCVLVPAFAVDRTPAILFALRELVQRGELPAVPVFVDSPMALRGLGIYREHTEFMDPDVARMLERGEDPFDPGDLRTAASPEQSRAINEVLYPSIIVSSSGMATGGRILHHLKRRLPDRRNLVLLVGFQAAGTRGRLLADGARYVKIHGQYVPVRAEVRSIEGFSAHADQNEILGWLGTFRSSPEVAYVVHGEPASAQALATRIERDLGWAAICPRPLERVALAQAL